MPYIQEALLRGLINYGAFANELLPKIKEELKKPIKLSAVIMALRRLSEKLELKNPKSFKFNQQIALTIKTGLFNMAYKKSPYISKALQKIYDTVDYSSGDVLMVNLGNHEVTIVSNNKYYTKLKELMKSEILIEDSKNVSAISLSLSLELMDTPGFFYLVTRTLTWENINIREVVSTPKELILIINDNDVTKGYTALKKLFG